MWALVKFLQLFPIFKIGIFLLNNYKEIMVSGQGKFHWRSNFLTHKVEESSVFIKVASHCPNRILKIETENGLSGPFQIL